MGDSNSVRAVAEQYAQVRQSREAMDRQLQQLKEKEDALKAALIQEMQSQGMPSVKLAGLGKFNIRKASNFEIKDIELFCRAIMARMVDNANHGRPWSDGLMLQKRPAKAVIEELMEIGYMDDAGLAGNGLGRLERFDLTFTKEKVEKVQQ